MSQCKAILVNCLKILIFILVRTVIIQSCLVSTCCLKNIGINDLQSIASPYYIFLKRWQLFRISINWKTVL